ncbi:MAG: pyrimidine/purine nucleoside phosphorylase [Gammaproteobacteria bacterium]|nr:pyrimidine/purine nucleoside phosphorylase [Gammaproteobacteria bacterium]
MLKVNEYFDGNIKSIAFKTETLPATVGVMLPGDYVFNTADQEEMTVISGALTIKLAGDGDFTTYTAGESFKVEANSAFDVKVETETAYLCLYG